MTWAEFKQCCEAQGILDPDQIEGIVYGEERESSWEEEDEPEVKIETEGQNMYHPKVTLTRKVRIK